MSYLYYTPIHTHFFLLSEKKILSYENHCSHIISVMWPENLQLVLLGSLFHCTYQSYKPVKLFYLVKTDITVFMIVCHPYTTYSFHRLYCVPFLQVSHLCLVSSSFVSCLNLSQKMLKDWMTVSQNPLSRTIHSQAVNGWRWPGSFRLFVRKPSVYENF